MENFPPTKKIPNIYIKSGYYTVIGIADFLILHLNIFNYEMVLRV